MSEELKPTRIVFEDQYLDGSGVEFGVSATPEQITLEHVETVHFPIHKLRWLIERLEYIQSELEVSKDGE